MSKICPHCHREIDYLRYSEAATVYGEYDLETEDYNTEETDTHGNTMYFCPRCDEEIEDRYALEDTEEENNPTTSPIPAEELPVPPAIKPEWNGEYSGFHNSHDTPKQSFILICPFCSNKNEIIEDEEINCYHCHQKLNKSNAKKVIPI